MDVQPWFAKLMVALAEAYPNTKLREGMVRTYAAFLQEHGEEAVTRAAGRCPQEFPSFFPTAGNWLSLLQGTGEDQGLAAWSGLCQAAAEVGAWQWLQCVRGADAAALLAVFGSWPAFCAECVEGGSMWASRRQEYLAAHRVARREPDTGPATLAGLADGWGWRGVLDGGRAMSRLERGAAPAALLAAEETDGEA